MMRSGEAFFKTIFIIKFYRQNNYHAAILWRPHKSLAFEWLTVLKFVEKKTHAMVKY